MAITTALRSISFLTLSLLICCTSSSAATRFDFDGDNRADLGVFRPSNGMWYIIESQTGTMKLVQFGQGGDIPLNADFDGDQRADVTIWRPSDGTWWFMRSSDGATAGAQWGQNGDRPVAGDYDGDGRTDLAVWRPSDGINYIVQSSGGFLGVQWGMDGDIPAPADIDNDGRTDFAVYRRSNGMWYTLREGTASAGQLEFGGSDDVPVTGDFDGDHKNDFAVYRPATGTFWYAASSQNNAHRATEWGFATDVPVTADYDGDGREDFAVWRPDNGNWYSINSANGGYRTTELGTGGDIPLPAPMMSNTSAPSFNCDYYASPTGSTTGTGSITSPWALQTALNKTALITTGKTLCMRGGTYYGKFISTLNGGTVRSAPGEWAKIDGYGTTLLAGPINASITSIEIASSSPIISGIMISIDSEEMYVMQIIDHNTIGVIRGWNGSTASSHSAGATVMPLGSTWKVEGSQSTYRDYEITNTWPMRDGEGNAFPIARRRGDGVLITGAGNNFINLIVHEHMDGFFSSEAANNTLIYGCLIYNNGSTNPPAGQGLYLQNNAGYSRVYESIIINNFGNGAQYYGTAATYVGGHTRGSIFGNSGSPNAGSGSLRNLLVGTQNTMINSFTLQDSYFFHPLANNIDQATLGYGAGLRNVVVTGNTVVGGTGKLDMGGVTDDATFTNNKIFATRSNACYTNSRPSTAYVWDNNTYYYDNGRYVYARTGQLLLNFPEWKAITGFDTSSTATNAFLPETVVVRPNQHTPGRANIVVYAANGASSVTVNLSNTGLVNGQGYTVKNAFNYFGPSVATGIYNSSSPIINLPLSGAARSVATPVGHSITPGTTLPDFGVFVVLPFPP